MHTHDCVAWYNANSIDTFTDDTTRIGQIYNNEMK